MNPPDPARRDHSFHPVVNSGTRVLVLGSLPGQRSLAEQRYYAHPQNRFWHLIGAVIGRDLPAMDYAQRLATLLEAGVGLWDTVASATRKGSLDSAIRNARHNPLADLVATLPRLQAIGFNGRTAHKIGILQLAGSDCALVPLPSSSPAYAAITLAQKTDQWMELRKFLH